MTAGNVTVLPADTVDPVDVMTCKPLNPEDEENMKVLRYVHLCVASLSILGATSIIMYSLYKRTCRSAEVRPIFHLAVADLGLAICWVIGAGVWSEARFQEKDQDFCIHLQVVTEAFHLATFFLTVNYALNVYVRTKDRQNRANNLQPLMETRGMVWALRLVIIFSWLLPIVLMIPVIYMPNSTSRCVRCLVLFDWPSMEHGDTGSWFCAHYDMLVFVIALVLSIIALLILYGLSYRVYKHLMSQNVWTDRHREALFNARHRITLYILVFMFCWLPALTIAFTRLIQDEELNVQRYFPLYLIQGVTAPAQGFLNCLVYGWTRPSFRSPPEHAPPQLPTTPLVKTTYRSYGVAGARKTFKRSVAESATPSPVDPSPKQSAT